MNDKFTIKCKVPIGEDDLYICKHSEKILEMIDETTLKEI